MIRKVFTLEFIVPALLALALGIIVPLGTVYLTDKLADLIVPRPGENRTHS